MAYLNTYEQQTNAHVCVCGGGVTGLSLALDLAERNPDKKIVVFECGGMGPSPEQAANVGNIIGNDVYDLVASRMRGLSGTQWIWGGNSRPFDPIDFEKRPWVKHSGWPIAYDDYAQYIEAATLALDIDDTDWSMEHPELNYLTYREASIFENNHFKLSPQINHNSEAATGVFHQSRQARLEAQQNLDIVLNHTLVDLDYDPINENINAAEFVDQAGNRQRFEFDYVIMALGCLENSRLLKYLTEKHDSFNLPGKKNIGRYFMEHPHSTLSKYLIADQQIKPYHEQIYGKQVGSAVHHPRLHVTSEAQRKHQLLNFNISFIASHRKHIEIWSHIDIENMVYSSVLSEQEPDFSNGIVMKQEKDQFGIPRIDLRWELSEQVIDCHNFVSEHFIRFMMVNDLARPWQKKYRYGMKLSGGHHHMGTTRMGHTPEEAVVDADCRVFGVKNLYMAGGSVFPTSGAVNPTLNMLALGYRLSDHLTREHLS